MFVCDRECVRIFGVCVYETREGYFWRVATDKYTEPRRAEKAQSI